MHTIMVQIRSVQTPRPVDLAAAFAKSAEGQTSSAEKEEAQPLASLEAEAPQPQASLARVMVTQDAKMVDAILGTSVSSTSAAMTELLEPQTSLAGDSLADATKARTSSSRALSMMLQRALRGDHKRSDPPPISDRTLQRRPSTADTILDKLNQEPAESEASQGAVTSPSGTCSMLADAVQGMFARLARQALDALQGDAELWGNTVRVASGCSGTDAVHSVYQEIFSQLGSMSMHDV